MKNSIIVLNILTFTILLCLFGCQNQEYKKEINTQISGKLFNLNDFTLEVNYNDSTFYEELTDDGNFNVTFQNLENPVDVSFVNENESFSIYITPGSQIELTADMNQFHHTVKFKGKNASINDYLVKSTRSEREQPTAYQLINQSEKEFLTIVDSLKNIKLDLLATYKDSINDPFFLQRRMGNIIYNWANELLTYQNLRVKNIGFKSDTVHRIIKNISLEKPEYINSYRFSNYAFDIIQQDVNSKLASMTFMKDQADSITLALSIKSCVNLIKNDQVKNHLIGEIINYYIPQLNLASAQYFTQIYGSSISKEQFNNIKAKVELLKPMAVGSSAPYFNLINSKGDSISLDDLSGKIIYIDFWASWCAPCLKELPAIKELAIEFENQPIHFIGISLDETQSQWQKALSQKDFVGIQLFAKGAESQIAQNYLVESIPHYILIDDFGNIINANASRPSIDARGQILRAIEKLELP